jgi:hypothetical protein
MNPAIHLHPVLSLRMCRTLLLVSLFALYYLLLKYADFTSDWQCWHSEVLCHSELKTYTTITYGDTINCWFKTNCNNDDTIMRVQEQQWGNKLWLNKLKILIQNPIKFLYFWHNIFLLHFCQSLILLWGPTSLLSNGYQRLFPQW